MKNKFSTLLTALIIVNTIGAMAYGFTNPLKSYDLYNDVHPTTDNEREQVVGDILNIKHSNTTSNSTSTSASKPTSASISLSPIPDYSSYSDSANVKTRNQTLRDSSKNVYSDPTKTPGWLEGPSFYPNPSFNSIVAKYKKSDFAGCMQESSSYVRLHPNDTLGYYYLAMCYAKVNDKENAVRAYEKVIALNANPMIVKYATNGRNCVMGNSSEQCYQNVNVPELIYPYANIPTSNLTPVDPQTLIDRNFAQLENKLSPTVNSTSSGDNANGKDGDKNGITLPFGNQDSDLDKFIKAPYGNGLSPELNKEYQQLQLKKIQETININDNNDQNQHTEIKYIKDFDNHKTDSGLIKLAYDIPQKEIDALSNDAEYIKSKQEFEELHALLNGSDFGTKENSSTDIVPYMTESGSKNLSPEVIQALMMKSVMGDLSL
jgi:tetratricopeptide (TPR) repeat protein